MKKQKKFKNLYKLLIGNIIKEGKKKRSVKLIQEVFLEIKEELLKDPYFVLFKIIKYLITPISIKLKTIAGLTYRIPNYISIYNAQKKAFKWFIKGVNARFQIDLYNKFTNEMIDTYNFNIRASRSLEMKIEHYKLCQENIAYTAFL